jgi:hypothetical protein
MPLWLPSSPRTHVPSLLLLHPTRRGGTGRFTPALEAVAHVDQCRKELDKAQRNTRRAQSEGISLFGVRVVMPHHHAAATARWGGGGGGTRPRH